MATGTKQGTYTGNGAGRVEKSAPSNTAENSKRVRAKPASASILSERDMLCLLQEALHLWSKTGKVTIQEHKGVLAIVLFPPDGNTIAYDPTIASIRYNGEAIGNV